MASQRRRCSSLTEASMASTRARTASRASCSEARRLLRLAISVWAELASSSHSPCREVVSVSAVSMKCRRSSRDFSSATSLDCPTFDLSISSMCLRRRSSWARLVSPFSPRALSSVSRRSASAPLSCCVSWASRPCLEWQSASPCSRWATRCTSEALPLASQACAPAAPPAPFCCSILRTFSVAPWKPAGTPCWPPGASGWGCWPAESPNICSRYSRRPTTDRLPACGVPAGFSCVASQSAACWSRGPPSCFSSLASRSVAVALCAWWCSS
mmetsp:Transcript_15127/g.45327  ORF Transcript_15127/g.45327 Transcript_15127/m.45327 type:complete len:271 (-) Transcript_15127:1312-2124(-)